MDCEETLAESWYRRARAAGVRQGSAGSEPGSAEPLLSGDAGDRWDPWEVWLRRIERPRRRETALLAHSADLGAPAGHQPGKLAAK